MERTVVVDASVALKWVIPETGQESARSLLKEFVFGDTQLIAPRTIRDEVASALSKRVRMKSITASEAQAAYDYFHKYRPLILDEPRIVKQAFALALQHHISYWDALYVALATEYRCDLVTADTRLHSAATKHYPYVELLQA